MPSFRFIFCFLLFFSACNKNTDLLDFPKVYHFQDIQLGSIEYFKWTNTGFQPINNLKGAAQANERSFPNDPGFKIQSFQFEDQSSAQLRAIHNKLIELPLNYSWSKGEIHLWYPFNRDEQWFLEGDLYDHHLNAPFFQCWNRKTPDQIFLRFQVQRFETGAHLLQHYFNEEWIYGFEAKIGDTIALRSGSVQYQMK